MKRLSNNCKRQALWGTIDPLTAVIHVWLTSIHIHLCLFHLRPVDYRLQTVAGVRFGQASLCLPHLHSQWHQTPEEAIWWTFLLCWEFSLKRPQKCQRSLYLLHVNPWLHSNSGTWGDYAIFFPCSTQKTLWWFPHFIVSHLTPDASYCNQLLLTLPTHAQASCAFQIRNDLYVLIFPSYRLH